jgi:hypothetical protein
MNDSIATWKLVGSVPVDAGCVLISDPCYVLPDKSRVLEDKTGMDYGVLIAAPERGNDWYRKGVVDLGDEPGGSWGATLIQNFGGDGVYPLYAKVGPGGRIDAVMIDFAGVAEEDLLVSAVEEWDR